MPQIAIVGLSSFGYYLALKLAELGSEVLVVDNDKEKVELIKDKVNKAVIADARDKRVLESLQLNEMDSVVLSLGEKMDISVLAVMHLQELGVKNIIAKALSEDHAKVLEKLGVNKIVFPERDMGERVATSLHQKRIEDYIPLGGEVSLIEMKPLQEMIGKTIKELDFRKKYNCQIVAIRRQIKQKQIEVPEPDMTIEPDDLLIIIGNNKSLERLQRR